jgi:hypothetical protein
MYKINSFGSQMQLDQHAVETIVNNLLNSIKGEKKDRLFTLGIRRKYGNRTVTILCLKMVNINQIEKLRKQLPNLIYMLVEDAKPNSIFTKYTFH